MNIYRSIFFLIACLSISVNIEAQLPESFQKAIEAIQTGNIGNVNPLREVKQIDNNTIHISLVFDLPEDVKQDDWQVNIKPAFEPSFNWAPHLTPSDDNVIDQHVFRTPAMIVADNKQVLVVIPDVEILRDGSPVRWYMDMDAGKNMLTLGMCNNTVPEHVLFKRAPGASYPKGKIRFGFYLMNFTGESDIKNPFRRPLEFFWNKWGADLFKEGNPLSGDLSPYVKHTYNWAFNTWGESVWQQFSLNGKQVGAPVFIVNTTQSPNYPGHVNEREFRSIWNQAWFSSLRSASGLFRYARRTGDKGLMEKANMTKELALSFPMKEGFFLRIDRCGNGRSGDRR